MKALIVFLKYPEKGKVKTRLAKSIGEENALKMYRKFVKDTLDNVIAIKDTTIFLFYTPAGKKRLLENLYGRRFKYCLQKGRDLGERMYNAFLQIKKLGFFKIAIIGTDSPTLPLIYIKQAFKKLESVDIVIGPSLDGGYYLLGLKKPVKKLFNKITWSSDRVFNQTLEKAKLLNLQINILPYWYDIDTIEGLRFFRLSSLRKVLRR